MWHFGNKIARTFLICGLASLAACVLEPAPPPVAVASPPGAPVAAVAPGYYAQPCCYAYPEYPPYPYYGYGPAYYGPPIGVGIEFGRGGRRWR